MDESVYTTLVDSVSDTLTYVAKAELGKTTAEHAWQIFVVDTSVAGITKILYPKNSLGVVTSDFAFSWDDRATYTYATN